MDRRTFSRTALLNTIALATAEQSIAEVPTRIGAQLPPTVLALLKATTDTDVTKVNIDWDGSIRIEALLALAQRGYGDGLTYARQWFEYHTTHTARLSDQEFWKTYEGPKGRIFRGGPIPFCIYSANLGLASPCYQLYRQTKDPRAKAAVLSVAEASLLYAARDQFGYLGHDDVNVRRWTIPDNAYFSVRSMGIASELVGKELKTIYLKDALHQAKACVNIFLNREKQLAHTIYYFDKQAPGPTFWCRSQGWVMFGIIFALRHIPQSHPDYPFFTRALEQLAAGLNRYQTTNGALRVFVDDPSAPEEVTGTAMTAYCIAEAMEKGWLANNYRGYVLAAWQYIQQSITPEGKLLNVYTPWAVPADGQRLIRMDDRYRGFASGLVLLASSRLISLSKS